MHPFFRDAIPKSYFFSLYKFLYELLALIIDKYHLALKIDKMCTLALNDYKSTVVAQTQRTKVDNVQIV